MVIFKEISLLVPEIIIAGFACFILVFDLFLKKHKKWIIFALSLLALLAALSYAFYLLFGNLLTSIGNLKGLSPSGFAGLSPSGLTAGSIINLKKQILFKDSFIVDNYIGGSYTHLSIRIQTICWCDGNK